MEWWVKLVVRCLMLGMYSLQKYKSRGSVCPVDLGARKPWFKQKAYSLRRK